MEVNATEKDVITWIGEVLRIEAEEEGEAYIFNLEKLGVRRTLSLSKDVLDTTHQG